VAGWPAGDALPQLLVGDHHLSAGCHTPLDHTFTALFCSGRVCHAANLGAYAPLSGQLELLMSHPQPIWQMHSSCGGFRWVTLCVDTKHCITPTFFMSLTLGSLRVWQTCRCEGVSQRQADGHEA
jgi:hypothetical protein